MIIGITGSIGSGKTTIAKLFSRHGFDIIDADEIWHLLIKKNPIAYKKIIKNFGNSILDKNKNIDRKRLGNVVFNDKEKLKKLNLIAHQLIAQEIRDKIKQIQKKCGSKTRIIIDAPLLLETKVKNLVDRIIVVKASEDKIIQRNRKFSREQIERILRRQMPAKEKLKYADFVIDNNKNLKQLERQVESISTQLIVEF